MVIELKSGEEFPKLLDALVQELWRATYHLKLHRGLAGKIETFRQVYDHSPAFWTNTFWAHRDAAIFGLMRIYDRDSKSLSLPNLLDTIKGKPGMFSNAKKPDEAQLDKDIEFASKNNPLVKKLIIWRNNLYAHRNAENSLDVYTKLSAGYPLTIEDTEELVGKGFEILNRYTHLFDASTYALNVPDLNDYEFVLTSIKARLDQEGREPSG